MTKDYLTALRFRTKLLHASRRQGWTEDNCFVLGQEYLMPNTAAVGLPDSKSDFGVCAGEIAPWARATRHLASDKMVAEAFTLLLTFASPLLKLLDLGGIMVLPYGKSGSGKTMLTRWIMSAWTHPTIIEPPCGDDIGTRMETYNRHGNLPIVFDGGASYYAIADVLKMSSDFSAGRGRLTASPNIAHLGRINQWSAVLMLTGFDGAYRRIVGDKRYKQNANHAPILEYEIGRTSVLRTNAAEIVDAISTNHGIIGRAYAQHIVDNRAEIQRFLLEWKSAIRDRSRINGYDNVVALIACAGVGGLIAEHLGLIEFSSVPAINFAVVKLQQIEIAMRRYQRQTINPRVRVKKKSPAPSSVPAT